jgi:osmoprotectant transport system ATP-binding protein
MTGLEPEQYHDREPRHLSGGQRQRVGLARALAARPRIMLMDEPFGALDPLTRDTLQTEFRHIHNDLELTTVMVTHDMTEALLLADRIAVMNEGRIVRLDTPHNLLSDPRDDYVKRLMDMPRRQADQVEELVSQADNGERARS